jgi:hypothetical protein
MKLCRHLLHQNITKAVGKAKECSPSFFLFYYIHRHIQCLGHFSPLPPTPSLTPPLPPLLPNPSLPGRNYSALISNFVEERV